MSKRKKYEYDIMKPVGTFAKIGVGIPVTFGMLGAGSGISPHGDIAVANVSRHAGTGFNLMGTQGMMEGSMGVIGGLGELKKLIK